MRIPRLAWLLGALSLALCAGTPAARASEAPKWMHALIGVPLPAHDEKTDAVVMYSDVSLTVDRNGKIKRLERLAYKILRPEGSNLGTLGFFTSRQSRITDLHAWCIPTAGKDYEVKQRDGAEAGLNIENGILVSDIRVFGLQVPAALPGNIIGYELEEELTPYILGDHWRFQSVLPVRESHYSLELPSGWAYKATWLNHPDEAPASLGPNRWGWTLSNVAGIREEPRMPPWPGIAGSLYLALIPPNTQGQSIQTWGELGTWYDGLTKGRRDPSADLKQKTEQLAAAEPTQLAKMQALASFVQADIRYVGIELGIGGYQPHAASEVFAHRYGDCKDKVTLLGAMLEQIGIHSYYVLVNTERGIVTASTPANPYFNHAIIAVALPPELDDPSLAATYKDPKLGRLLIFDPTNPFTPFGSLSGALQANYGLLVAGDGSALIHLPQLPAASNGITRTAQLSLDENGTLRGNVHEVRVGDTAVEERVALRYAAADTDRIKPVETMLAASLSTYQITKASVLNLRMAQKPFEWFYSVESEHYARAAGDLILVRPRVMGKKSRAFLETKEPREHAIEFEGPQRDTDVFELTLPAGYQVDSLPPPADFSNGFASYHSKTEVVGRTLKYTREYKIEQLSVPVEKADEIKSLYRIIETDEHNDAVLKRTSP